MFDQKKVKAAIDNFFADESGGERDTLTTLLLLALIILPLVALIVWMGDDIAKKVKDIWKKIMKGGVKSPK